MDNNSNSSSRYELMTATAVPKLIIRLSIPTTMSMLISSVYNLADTYFVSQLSTSASAAVGVVFSLMTVLQAVGFTLGMGSGSLISRRLGEKDKKSADMYAATAFYTSLLLGALIMIFGHIFIEPLMLLLGATQSVLKPAKDYAFYILFGAPVMCGSFVMNNILRSEGRAKLATIGLTVGGVLNIALDPLLIFTFNMGVSGAAAATLISQSAGFIVLLLIRKKSEISLSPKNFSFSPRVISQIVVTGMPSLGRQGLAGISTVLLNRACAAYGEQAMAAMSIVAKVCMLVMCVCIGIGHGFMPVCGFNYGAKRYDRVRKSLSFTIILDLVVMSALAAVLFVFSPQVMTAFRADDADVIAIGTAAMRAQCISIVFMAMTACITSAYQALGKSVRALLLSCCRQGIFFVPLIYLLPRCFGLTGIEWTQSAADILSFTVACALLIMLVREIKKEESQLKSASSAE